MEANKESLKLMHRTMIIMSFAFLFFITVLIVIADVRLPALLGCVIDYYFINTVVTSQKQLDLLKQTDGDTA